MDLVVNKENEARDVFQTFKERWGLEALFQELDVPGAGIHDKTPEEQFALFRATLGAVGEEGRIVVVPGPVAVPAAADKRPAEPAEKSLKDRIEDARNDPRIPRQVMQVIDKNRLNAIGYSGSKYSELAGNPAGHPWGRSRRFRVSAADFEEGLNRTHYGLERPKEIPL